MPFHVLLIGIPGAQNARLIEWFSDELQGNRQLILGKSARYRQSRQTGQIERAVIFRNDVLEKSIDRPDVFHAWRRTRLIGQRETVDLSEYLRQFGATSAANPLCPPSEH